jgi:hypothetical protein
MGARASVLLVACLLALWAGPASAAAPTFVSVSAIAAATSGDVTITLGTHATNDIILISAWVRSNTETVTVGGYTAITGTPFDRGTTSRYWLWWKRATSAADGNPLVDTDGTTANIYAMAIVYRGAITTETPWEVVGTPATGTADPASCTGITTLTDNSLVVVPYGYEDNNGSAITTTGTDPAAYTEHLDEAVTGDDGTVSFSEAARTAAGATGTVSVDYDSTITAGDGWGCVVLALKPAPPPPIPPAGLLLLGVGL